MKEYIFKSGGIINLVKISKSANVKLGKGALVVQTYHFAQEQIDNIDLTLDKANCLGCPLSYSDGNGKCYTHKGMQRLGLMAMMKRISKMDGIQEFDIDTLTEYVEYLKTKNVKLVRFGAYGEPIFLPIKAVELLSKVAVWTGYTHTWSFDNTEYSKFFMASTHNMMEVALAKDMGWRVFNTGNIVGAVNCPASKEAGKKSVCSQCALCGGTEGKTHKDIYIELH